jgi:hypothetical protein
MNMTTKCEFPCSCGNPNDCSHDDSCTSCDQPAVTTADDVDGNVFPVCDKHYVYNDACKLRTS